MHLHLNFGMVRSCFNRNLCFSEHQIQCKDIMLEDVDVAKALIEYVSQSAIENLVLGTSSRNGFLR